MSTELAIRDGQSGFDAKQIAALEQLGVSGASRADQAIFFHQCVRTGLDPFLRQVYMIERKQWDTRKKMMVDKQTIQTGIDGFRLIARRAVDKRKETLGYGDTLWCGDDGLWRDVWLPTEPPSAAKVTVFRDGQPFSAVALMREFRATKKDGAPMAQWASKPVHMIAKCAEALALRMAFPQDLSGLYTTDETGAEPPDVATAPEDMPPGSTGTRRMSRNRDDGIVVAEVVEPPDPATPEPSGLDEFHPDTTSNPDPSDAEMEPPGITRAQSTKLHAVFGDLKITDRNSKLRAVSAIIGRTVESSSQVTQAEAVKLIDQLERAVEMSETAEAVPV